MRACDYITVRAPLWVIHSGAKGIGRKGCWAKRVFEKGGPESIRICRCGCAERMAISILFFMAQKYKARGPPSLYCTLLALPASHSFLLRAATGVHRMVGSNCLNYLPT